MQEKIAAFLYAIAVATITLLYMDYENIELLKHPIDTLMVLRNQAESD